MGSFKCDVCGHEWDNDHVTPVCPNHAAHQDAIAWSEALERAKKYPDPAKPDDIRDAGWLVAVHNDYKLNGVFHTFWLFTNASAERCVKGEGQSDVIALSVVRAKLGLPMIGIV